MVITEKTDLKRIAMLSALTNKETYWDDVAKLCRKVTGRHAIERWKMLSDERYRELCEL